MSKKYLIGIILICCAFSVIGCSKQKSNEVTPTPTQSISNEVTPTSTPGITNEVTPISEPTVTPDPAATANTENDFEIFYQGFIPVDADKVDNYNMRNDYIITNEEDWTTWSEKYDISKYPYYLEDFDWDKDCLIVYASYGNKDFYNTIRSIEDVSFENNKVDVMISNTKAPVYAFNTIELRHIALYVIKVEKPSNLSSIDSSFFTYKTYNDIE